MTGAGEDAITKTAAESAAAQAATGAVPDAVAGAAMEVTEDRPGPDYGARRRDARRTVRRQRLAVVIFALLMVLAGPASGLGASEFVSVDGVVAQIGRDTTLAQLTGLQDLSLQPGSTLDVTGDVILPGGGASGFVSVNGRPFPAIGVLHDGATIVGRRGADRTERLRREEKGIAPVWETRGSGPVVTQVREGKPGLEERFRGEHSTAPVAAFVLREAEVGLLERTSAVPTGHKAVALTFDDGPSEHTVEILAILEKKGVPATFFWIGKVAASYKSVTANARAAGHEIENHTWGHADLTKLGADGLSAEISRGAAAVGGARFLRPPYGAYNAAVAAEAARQGQRIAMWDVDTLDWKIRDAASIASRVKAAVKPGAVILMHDGGGDRSQTVAALPGIIDWLLMNGYSLTTLQGMSTG
ncbi:MAG: polysaccharide deacetylase family protein [Actinobacteria bacterium]|nr:polysaccharide deacetylase family protein [Actinomycetota bacterium]